MRLWACQPASTKPVISLALGALSNSGSGSTVVIPWAIEESAGLYRGLRQREIHVMSFGRSCSYSSCNPLWQKHSLMRKVLVLIVLLAAVMGGSWFFRAGLKDPAPQWQLAQIELGTIEEAVSATGRVDPVMTVDISSQVSGQVAKVLVDFNSKVAAGEILARIDPAPFEARVQIARADLKFAQANVAMQRAVEDELKAERSGAQAALDELEENLKRQRALLDRKVVSESIVGSALAQRDQARARLESIQARLVKQRAQVRSAEAQVESRLGGLRERELDLSYTVIQSPVEGIVINRDVDVGQTVAASLQAPVLFTLAQDLQQVQIEVSVDEADIGRVHNEQRVRFTVDAYPDRHFSGQVSQVRKAPQIDSGVVTYRGMVATHNDDEALLPGMTATVEIIVGRHENVLRVPEAALRFRPRGVSDASSAGPGHGRQRSAARLEKLSATLDLSDDQQAAAKAIFREIGASMRALHESTMDENARRDGRNQIRSQAVTRIEALLNQQQKMRYQQMRAESAGQTQRRGTLWRPDGPTAVSVAIGLSDGSYSEVSNDNLTAGDVVIIGQRHISR